MARERGGFWRRVTAFAIDLMIATLLIQVLAFALYPATGGRVQFSGGFMLLYCDKLASVPEGFELPADFVPTSIADCRQGLFQLTSARVLNVVQATKNGALTTTKYVTFLRDAAGKPVTHPILPLLWLPLFFVLRVVFDRRRGTPGRRMLGVRLVDAANGWQPPPRAVLRRYLWQALPLAPYVILPLLLDLSGASVTPFSAAWWMVIMLPAVCAAVGGLMTLHHVIYRRDAFYDSTAQTSVLQINGAAASVPLAAASLPQIAPDESERAVADALGLASANQAAPPLPLFALPPPLPRRANYLVRHWRGELSLPVAYWVNGTLLGAGAGVAIFVVGRLLGENGGEHPPLWLALLIAMWTAIVLLRVWVAVGVWRSAQRYQASGKPFWGGAAKVLIVLGVAFGIYNFAFVAAPQIAGIYEIVAGDARVGPHQFRVLGNGQVLEFTGGITFGVARELEALLGAMPSLKTVQLNSIGGRMVEAQKMADIIKARGLNTYVALSCVSACTVVFLGGKDRVLRRDHGKLGFHQTSFRGMTAFDRTAGIAEEIARLERFGLSHAFAERATATPPERMWYPDQDELLREKVVTRLVPPKPPEPAAEAAPAAQAPAASPAQTPEEASPATAAPVSPPPQAEPDPNRRGVVKLPSDLLKRLTGGGK